MAKADRLPSFRRTPRSSSKSSSSASKARPMHRKNSLFLVAAAGLALAGCTTRMHGSEAGPPPVEAPRAPTEPRAPQAKSAPSPAAPTTAPEKESKGAPKDEQAKKETILARHVLIQW